MDKDFLRTEIEVNVTFLIILPVPDQPWSPISFLRSTLAVILALDNYCSVRVLLYPSKRDIQCTLQNKMGKSYNNSP